MFRRAVVREGVRGIGGARWFLPTPISHPGSAALSLGAGSCTRRPAREGPAMPTIAAPRLRELALTIVRAVGSREEEARDVADHLAGANLSGHDSHGIGMLPDYVRRLHAGLVVPNRELRLLGDAGAVLLFDGGHGFGQRMAKEAMRQGAERAKRQGAVVVALRNAAHVGRVGTYGE